MVQRIPNFLVILLILGAVGRLHADNPWPGKVASAMARASLDPSPAALEEALDIAWRADNWSAGLKLVELAERGQVSEPRVLGRCVRAIWRSGDFVRAERFAEQLPPTVSDSTTCGVLLELDLSRGRGDRAATLLKRIEDDDRASAEALTMALTARMQFRLAADYPGLAERALHAMDSDGRYPDESLRETLDGLPGYLRKVGSEPLNQMKKYGAAAMTEIVVIRLPMVEARINGKGPYRLVVDTGGSNGLSLDTVVAEEVGLPSLGEAKIRGVRGWDTSQQSLVETLDMGEIRVGRVLTRVFAARQALMNAADGILGTGVFGNARMTMDFRAGRLVVEPTSDKPAAGVETTLRIVRDAKLMVRVRVEDQELTALFDSGADVVALSPSRMRLLFPGETAFVAPTGIGAGGVGAEAGPQVSLHSGVDLEIAKRAYKGYSGLGLDVLDNLLGPALGIQADVLVGMSVFRDMNHVVVDYPKCRMWIDWLPVE